MTTPNTFIPTLVGLMLGLSLVGGAPAARATAPPADAVDPQASPAVVSAGDGLRFNLSGFGTLGWARSNRDWAYQRFVDRDGSFERDTVLGGQLDVQLSGQWSAAVQLKLAPSNRSDSAWRLHPSWAFVAWRPGNDWLLRAGRLRLPTYLRSEQMDVAATYAVARLPAEVYGVLPPEDLDSVNVTRSWSVGSGELTLDAYTGRSTQTVRTWAREGLGTVMPAGANFIRMTTAVQGLVATWNGPDSKARLGLHRVVVTPPASIAVPVRPVWVAVGPGLGYWKSSAAMPGPDVETLSQVKNYYLAAGVEFSPAPGWRVTSEINRVRPMNTERGIDTRGAYVTVLRQLGRWSPYATYGRLISPALNRAWARTLDETSLPGAEMLNASMRVAADAVPVYDQHSVALGTAYALAPNSLLKAEWLHLHADASGMFDLPAGQRLFQPRSVDVLTVNYSVTF